MKKLTSLFTAAALILSASAAVAADKEAREPDVFVNETLVEFADQNAYITDEGRTLVPARGVFEAMDCEVDWDAENYVVTVTNESQKKEITLTIDNTEMKVVTDGKETVKTLDVPATLMNNRTMVPLRAISESLGCMVVWNEAEYSVGISYTKQITAEEFSQILQNIFNGSGDKEDKPEIYEPPIEKNDKMIISLYSDAKDVEVGEEFEVFVKLANPPTGYLLNGVKISFVYDKDLISYVEESSSILNMNGEKASTTLFAENMDFSLGAKLVYLNIDGVRVSEDGSLVFSSKFVKLTDAPVEISVDNSIESNGNSSTYFIMTLDEEHEIEYSGERLLLNNVPLVIK